MPRLVRVLLLLGLLATPTPAENGILPLLADLLSPDSGGEMDPNGSPISSEPSPDSGWEYDPNG
jgi:hypothetical protein